MLLWLHSASWELMICTHIPKLPGPPSWCISWSRIMFQSLSDLMQYGFNISKESKLLVGYMGQVQVDFLYTSHFYLIKNGKGVCRHKVRCFPEEVGDHCCSCGWCWWAGTGWHMQIAQRTTATLPIPPDWEQVLFLLGRRVCSPA